ncbi:response regulator [Gilvimarinus sp. SDUM040013]|uniref:Response regulator n=1 Tax=Gilvimarinus gilvus TaxID=3058038 RepID=A0ABU4RYH6_9GAMM|nr:response regulator [Gilvimarinus sp. SDUM040013]MDO3385636.1 response regulator [Gilvimarinus sp. SDUM040013]MDX6849970.1 response regulator [Gilvimarinus sp. SDUM040013]
MNSYSVLIVDDSYENQKNIFGAMEGCERYSHNSVISIKDAITAMRNEQYDIMFLDIQIPMHLSGEISSNGGLELLKQIGLRDDIYIPHHIVGMTSHSDSYHTHKVYFESLGWPIFLNASIEEVREILNIKSRHSPRKKIKVDVAILTALRKTELDAVLSLPCNWEKLPHKDVNTIYYVGIFNDRHGEKKTILATSCPRMGASASSSISMKICEEFSPELLVMTGIAAGIKGKVNIGDILVADPCWDWGSGKITYKNGKIEFLSSPHQMHIEPRFRTFFQDVSAERTFLDEIYSNWKHPGKPSHLLSLHVGPIATGSVVLEDPATVDGIKKQNRDVIGVEMEGYGLFSATKYASNFVEPLLVKSVCDFADPDKDDSWQAYAAYTSASLVYRFLTTSY